MAPAMERAITIGTGVAAAPVVAMAAGVSATMLPTFAVRAAPAASGIGRVLLEADKQGKHIFGHNNFIEGRSIFTHANAQALLDEFAGTGQRLAGAFGGPGKERVNFGQVIGQINVNGVMTNTTNGIIHYSKTGAHIVPANPPR